MAVYVVKSSGERVKFDPRKVERSLINSGASEETAGRVVGELQKRIRDGITTREIHELSSRLLEEEDRASATRYGLKQAIMRLGPSGFPFEKFFAGLLEGNGYSTQLNRVFKGRCVDQEVDIVAEGPEGKILVECKYHNMQGIYTGLKEAMYTHARLQDVNEGGGDFDLAWLVCNTKVSVDGIKYAKCRGMKVTAWHYPLKAGIEDMIGKTGLYPVTILRSVDEDAKSRLADANLVMTKTLLDLTAEEVAARTKLPSGKVNLMRSEARELASVGGKTHL